MRQEGVKQEPASQPSTSAPQPNYNGMDNKNSVAANRAAQQLQLQYGMRAAGSINAIQDRMGQQQPQTQQPGGQPTGQEMGEATGFQLPADATNHMGNGQTDGAGDEEGLEGVLLQRGVGGNLHELGRVEIDRMLHEQMAIKAKAMEGGGLMLPLKEATGRSANSARRQEKGKGIAAFDGGNEDDDDVEDEDAINSDLDDPEEDRDDDEVDDEGLGHIMLCMYDKVQRVKNKWYACVPGSCRVPRGESDSCLDRKCTLKDGVLTVNGKEYVFHKATGEYEW